MRTKRRLRIFDLNLMAIVLCCASVIGFAQTDRGSIIGTVTDPSANVVAGASVIATSASMGTQYPTVTTTTGEYVVPQLPAGVYSLTVSAPGFSTLVRSGITVVVSQSARADVHLAVGRASETVTVTADAPLLQADNPQNNIIVKAEDMNELPINVGSVGAIRDPLMFAALAPGTEVNVNGNSWNDIHINGAPGWTYRMLIDGMESSSPINARITDESQTSVEAIGEFSLQQNSYSAEFGGSLGGVYNFTAKSGTNTFHGSLFNYLENDSFLNAGQPFNFDAAGHNYVPFEKQENFGGSFGGPVDIPHFLNGRNRTFFFFSYEQYHDAQTYNYGTMTVPTAAYRSGDLSYRYLQQGAPIQVHRVNPDGTEGPLATDCLGRPVYEYAVYDPKSTRAETCVSTSNGNAPGSVAAVRDPFPDNYIGDPGTWDSVSQNVLGLIPTPHGATADAPTNNYPYLVPGNKFQYLPSIRGDQKITDKFHISGFFSNEKTNKDNWGTGWGGGALDTLRWMTIHGLLAYATGDYIISPHLEVHGGLGYHRHNSPQSAADLNVDQQKLLGLPSQGNLPGYHAPTFPAIWGLSVNGSGVNEMGSDVDNLTDNNYQAVGALTWVHGPHNFKFGGDVRLEAFSNWGTGSSGQYWFGGDQTGLPSEDSESTYEGANLGDGFASFALGQLQGASISVAPFPWWIRHSGSIYGQDTWRITSKLTASYGIRWDFMAQDHEQKYRETAFSPTVSNPNAGGLLGGTVYEGYGAGRCNCTFEKLYPWMIQPRLGFLYQVDPKTVVHISSGIYSGQQSWNGVNSPSYQGFGWNTANLVSPGNGLPAGQFATGFTASDLVGITATDFDPGAWTQDGTIQSPPAMAYPANDGRPPRMVHTDIGVQRELSRDLMVEAAWVDIKGSRLESDNLVNNALNGLSPSRAESFGLDPTNPTDINFLNEPISSPDAAARGFHAPYSGFPTWASVAQSLRPFPQFGNLGYMYADVGNWWYDALQVKLTKRMSHGISAMVNYTWSKDLGTADNSSEVGNGGASPVQNSFLPPKSQKTYESIDIPQMLKFNFQAEVPTFGFAESGWKRVMLKHWTFDGIFSYQSGFVIGPIWASSLWPATFQGEAGVWMNRVPGQKLFLHDLNKHDVDPYDTFFLNPAAWVNPAAGQYGSGKPYYSDFRGPRYPNEQMGMGKRFGIGERMHFSVRADFFNVFNRWAYPGLNVGSPFNTVQHSTVQLNPAWAPREVITSGFGYIGSGISGASGNMPPRSGEIVARFEF